MKKALVIAGILALSITSTASFADHLKPKESEIRVGGNLDHTNLSDAYLFRTNLSDANLENSNLRNANLRLANLVDAFLFNSDLSGAFLVGADMSNAILSGANLWRANLSDADLTDITATNLRACPRYLPSGWVCENNSLIQG